MTNDGQPPQTGADHSDLGATDARGGETTGHIRWVLIFGTVLAVVALAVAALSFYASHSRSPPPAQRAQHAGLTLDKARA